MALLRGPKARFAIGPVVGDAIALIGEGPGTGERPDALGDLQASLEPIFMETVAHPGASEPGVVPALDLPEIALGGDGAGIEQRMLIIDHGLHTAGREIAVRVERDEEIGG